MKPVKDEKGQVGVLLWLVVIICAFGLFGGLVLNKFFFLLLLALLLLLFV